MSEGIAGPSGPGGYKSRVRVLQARGWTTGLTTYSCKRNIVIKSQKPRPDLGYTAFVDDTIPREPRVTLFTSNKQLFFMWLKYEITVLSSFILFQYIYIYITKLAYLYTSRCFTFILSCKMLVCFLCRPTSNQMSISCSSEYRI